MSFTGRSYGQTVSTGSSSTTKVVEDSKKKTSLLKDNSWIKTNVNEEEPVERESNFGKTVLTRYKSNENLISPADSKTSKNESKTTTTTTTTSSSVSSVQALSKRFGGSQDKLNESRTTGTKTTVKTEPKTSTTTTTVKDGTKITETTVTTTSKDVVKSRAAMFSERDQSNLKKSSGDYKTEVITVKSSKDTIDGPTSPVKTTTSVKTYTKEEVSPAKTTSRSIQSTKSDYKTEVITVKSSKETIDVPKSPVKNTTSIKTYTNKEEVSPTKTTTYSVRSTKSTEDQLFDTLIPSSIKTTYTKPDSIDYKTEVITVKSSKETIDVPSSPVKTTTSIKTYTKEEVSPATTKSYSIQSTKSTEDQLFDTLIPTSIKTTYTNKDSSREDTTVSETTRTVYSTNDRHEWSSVSSPTFTRTSYTENRPTDYLSDSLTSKTTTTVYTSPERTVSERDLCTYCRKNMYNAEKMILDDMNISCHASCFKCEVCNTSLGNLKAGDSLWVYRRSIHCESCFGVTKGKWHR
ncbi:sciellin-like isoform X1 [Xyrauchen texanus]|uniref:sciellin-like isoform X1 n=1 Tax=Xyrauchen texanus TaxID=154827 RepID=UPI00224242D6|nr:sciellin-like isoform X1 [Xyrauchen texanus]